MSLVALGPETKVNGAAGGRPARRIASGTVGDDLVRASTMADVEVGDERQRARPGPERSPPSRTIVPVSAMASRARPVDGAVEGVEPP